jgi:hypothetical protein
MPIVTPGVCADQIMSTCVYSYAQLDPQVATSPRHHEAVDCRSYVESHVGDFNHVTIAVPQGHAADDDVNTSDSLNLRP